MRNFLLSIGTLVIISLGFASYFQVTSQENFSYNVWGVISCPKPYQDPFGLSVLLARFDNPAFSYFPNSTEKTTFRCTTSPWYFFVMDFCFAFLVVFLVCLYIWTCIRGYQKYIRQKEVAWRIVYDFFAVVGLLFLSMGIGLLTLTQILF